MDERIMEQIRKDNETRLRRAGAWIEKAEKAEFATDDTSRFIFYWIAFNAQYSRDDNEVSEWCMRNKFLETIFSKDKDFSLVDIINDNQDALKRIFELPQTYWYFWKEPEPEEKIENIEQWKKHFEKPSTLPFIYPSKKGFNLSQIEFTLRLIFERLSVVRNQIFHGSHSGNEHSHGYTQVEKGAELLSKFVPCFFHIMDISIGKNPDENWGAVRYRPQGTPDDVDCPPPWLVDKK